MTITISLFKVVKSILMIAIAYHYYGLPLVALLLINSIYITYEPKS